MISRDEIRTKYGRERQSLADRIKAGQPALVAPLKRLAASLGYGYGMWARHVMYEICGAKITALGPERLDAMEISAGEFWRRLPFRSFVSMDYPQYDITKDVLPQRFDLIIADNIFEHLPHPTRAARNVLTMLQPGGLFLNITPFMVRVHNIPIDCTRWTELGMRYFLEDAGFDPQAIETGAWGNRAVIKADFTRWSRRGFWGSLKNEPRFPVQIWALARSPKTHAADQLP